MLTSYEIMRKNIFSYTWVTPPSPVLHVDVIWNSLWFFQYAKTPKGAIRLNPAFYVMIMCLYNFTKKNKFFFVHKSWLFFFTGRKAKRYSVQTSFITLSSHCFIKIPSIKGISLLDLILQRGPCGHLSENVLEKIMIKVLSCLTKSTYRSSQIAFIYYIKTSFQQNHAHTTIKHTLIVPKMLTSQKSLFSHISSPPVPSLYLIVSLELNFGLHLVREVL